MNYYERIQKSIDYIESRLKDNIEIEKAAAESYMSSSTVPRQPCHRNSHPWQEPSLHLDKKSK
ncbi:MAG TPA: hypothetical protein PK767_07230 [Clostridiales bacterium]|nr:hypothetical protein [Clostridiales bacterium]HOL92662.1 hypothetical protein [Clostridiales bacterium]HPP36021.1 hypothetical protein [Clostridiales bacterium]